MKIIAGIISILAIIVSVLWYYKQPGYEPAITALTGLAGLLYTIQVKPFRKNKSIQNIPLREINFVDPPGYYTHPKYPNKKICPDCLIKNKLISPVSEIDKNAWYCTVCKQPLSCSKGEVFSVDW